MTDDYDLAANAGEIMRLLGEFEAAVARRREAEIDCARALAALDALKGWAFAGCASVAELGERHAVPAAEARSLLGFGRAMRALPYVEEQVRTGRITAAAAGCLGEVLGDPTLQRPDDDWVGWAQTESTRSLRRRVQRRREEALQDGTPTVALTVFVPLRTQEGFERARAIASRRASRALTEGEAFTTVVEHYLDCYDDERTQPGKRRLPETSFVAGRYVPMAVRREVYERQGRRCAVPLCDHSLFLELAHLVAHASGGSREADNLILLCSTHHLWFDNGYLFLPGTAAKPRFTDRQGRDLTHRFERGELEPWLHDPPDPGGEGSGIGDGPDGDANGRGCGEPASRKAPGHARPTPPDAPSQAEQLEPTESASP